MLSSRIELQHKRFEKWMDASGTEPPHIETHLQSSDTGLQYTVLFPVEIDNEASSDEMIVNQFLQEIGRMDGAKSALDAPPTVKATIRT